MNTASPTYRDHTIPAIYRLLGNLDRNPASSTFGSLSRDAWRYRFGARFHPATRQCVVYPLARLYAHPAGGAEFHRNPRVLSHIESILGFTASLQNADGSFSEWYRGQPSHCATAYLAAYLSETLLGIADEIPPPLRQAVAAAVRRAAARLGRPPGESPGNQSAAALLALRNCAILSGGRGAEASVAARDRLLRRLHPDGWFPEHGGPDVGYASLTLDMLTRCSDRGMGGLEEAIGRGLSFLDRFVLPDGTFPSVLNWRDTGFLAPFAAERMAPRLESARRLAFRIRRAVNGGRLPTPDTTDDRYAAHFFLPSFVDAFLCASDLGAEGSAHPSDPEIDTRSGELRMFDGPAFRVGIQGRKGTIAVYSHALSRPILEGPAPCLRSTRGMYAPRPSEEYRFSPDGTYAFQTVFGRILGEGRGARAALTVFPAVAAAGLHMPSRVRERIEGILKRAAFAPRDGRSPARLSRQVHVAEGEIRIRDTVQGENGSCRTQLFPLFGCVPSNQPSSGFFTRPELTGPLPPVPEFGSTAAAEWAANGTVEMEVTLAGTETGVRALYKVNGKEIGRAETGSPPENGR